MSILIVAVFQSKTIISLLSIEQATLTKYQSNSISNFVIVPVTVFKSITVFIKGSWSVSVTIKVTSKFHDISDKAFELPKGFLKIKTQILDILKNQGLEEIESRGKKFDPNFQEAVEIIKKKGYESGIVIEEIQKGYLLHGKVIRPAKVKISK